MNDYFHDEARIFRWEEILKGGGKIFQLNLTIWLH